MVVELWTLEVHTWLRPILLLRASVCFAGSDDAISTFIPAGMDTTCDVLKSPSDTRLYRPLLLPNQLKVMLIHDAQAEKAAASLDVNVGMLAPMNID